MAYSFQGIHFSHNRDLIADKQMIFKRSPLTTQYSYGAHLADMDIVPAENELYGFKFRPYGHVGVNEFVYTYGVEEVDDTKVGVLQLLVRDHRTYETLYKQTAIDQHHRRVPTSDEFINLVLQITLQALGEQMDNDEIVQAKQTLLSMARRSIWSELMNRMEKTYANVMELQFIEYAAPLPGVLSSSITDVSHDPDAPLKQLKFSLDGTRFSIQERSLYTIEVHVNDELVVRQISKEPRSWTTLTMTDFIFHDSFRELLVELGVDIPPAYNAIMWNNYTPMFTLPATRKEPW